MGILKKLFPVKKIEFKEEHHLVKHKVLEYSDGSGYNGEYLDGAMNGHGIYRFSSGSIYEGLFFNNKRSGFGICTYENGEMIKSMEEVLIII